MSGRVLGDASVVLTNPDTGKREQFLPGAELPAWAAKLVGDHVYADAGADEATEPKPPAAKKPAKKAAAKKTAASREPATADDAGPGEDDGAGANDDESDGDSDDEDGDHEGEIPPQSGRGSSRDSWAAYAGSLGVDVDAESSRDDIIAAIDAAGHPVA